MGKIALLSIVSTIACVDVSSVELCNHDIIGGGLPELEQLKMASSPAICVIELSGWFIITGGTEDDIKRDKEDGVGKVRKNEKMEGTKKTMKYRYDNNMSFKDTVHMYM